MLPSHDINAGQRSALLRRGYLLLWVSLATILLTQVVWFSGWADVPGGSGDGRLNNLILEHGYQAIRGVYPFTSPGQFNPTADTLAYSDSHWGTLPLYALARSLGFSVATAFQIWAVFLAAANATAVLYLLRVCRTPWLLAGPICFLAIAPASAVWFAGGHIQLLPLFPLPLALAQVIRWAQTRRAIHLLLALAFLCWLLLSSPYLGFFGTLALLSFAVFSRILLPGESAAACPESQIRLRQYLAAAGFLLLVGLPTLLLYLLYFAESRSGGNRPWTEMVDIAPTWQAWLTAPPGNWLHGGGWPRWRPLNLSEQALFSGWIPWLALISGLTLTWSRPRSIEKSLALVFALTALAAVVFFTDWTGEGEGLFLWLARRLEGLRAFRATGRVILVVHLMQSLALGMMVTAAWRRFRTRSSRIFLTALTLFAVLETLSFEQPGTPKALLEARRHAVLEAWRREGDRPILVFAPAPSNQDPASIHLDAWAAALASDRQTVNGYSGREPDGYGRFLADPTVNKARGLIHNLGLDPATISVVTSWGAAGSRLGIHQTDSQPVRPLEGFGLQPVWWELSYPVQSFTMDGQPVHQFTPKSTVVFGLPAGTRKIHFLFGLRDGAYSDGGDSDGVGLRLSVGSPTSEVEVLHVHWNPRDHEEQRGLQWLEVPLSEVEDTRLVLRVDYGPAGDGRWDWPVFGRLEAVASENQP
ncbi:MAG: hypothetical protein R3F07_01335 [Opitutaceae bacterium]